MRSSQGAKNGDEGSLWETFKVVIQAVLLALVVRTFLFQPFNIPSSSMVSTLLVGDYIFVSKYSYGYSKFSFPLSSDLFEGRIWNGKPERGDVAVFRLPTNTSLDYVKRVIGLPGDSVQMIDGALYINGVAVKREANGPFEPQKFGIASSNSQAQVYTETLPNGASYQTLDVTPNGDLDNTREFVVPEGHYFMMGDNRDNSADSRTPQVGFVPVENFIGRADVIFFSIGSGSRPWQIWNWFSDLRPSRIFSGL